MEKIFEWRRFDVQGQLWATACTPPDQQQEARRWISEAQRGALRSYIATGLTRRGRRMLLHFDFSLVGQGAAGPS